MKNTVQLWLEIRLLDELFALSVSLVVVFAGLAIMWREARSEKEERNRAWRDGGGGDL